MLWHQDHDVQILARSPLVVEKLHQRLYEILKWNEICAIVMLEKRIRVGPIPGNLSIVTIIRRERVDDEWPMKLVDAQEQLLLKSSAWMLVSMCSGQLQPGQSISRDVLGAFEVDSDGLAAK